MMALVDCNAFYVSCERVFNPSLRGRAVVVLSNNDGCVVARSMEAKQVPIAMGMPLFEFRDAVDSGQVIALSSNYVLYGDMSQRVMAVLADFSPHQEIYSIDECFLDLSGNPDPMAAMHQARCRVLREVGVPVSIGIATSKTLAKLGSFLAKSADAGVVAMAAPGAQLAKQLGGIPMGEVWGIGPRVEEGLRAWGVSTALDVARLSPERMRKRFSITGERVVRELRGERCLGIEMMPPPKQTLTVSRSFGVEVDTLDELRAAVGVFMETAAEKARRAGLAASAVSVWVAANPFDPRAPACSGGFTQPCSIPTNHTLELLRYGDRMVKQLWKSGGRWKKAGVMLVGLEPTGGRQESFLDAKDRQAMDRLMIHVDRLNRQHGRSVVRSGVTMLSRRWKPLAARCSPCYTTRWGEILRVP